MEHDVGVDAVVLFMKITECRMVRVHVKYKLHTM